ncbi:hypothetical protein OG458_22885 [Streptomyces sp. NBC_01281]|uniref:hypothetical protein n=1 Tax=unclassified Streptomyces TaxID=2593676 RepID=UPI0009C0BA5F|nr:MULTISPECIES: hypothetical protein [unclassified Streptomyces]OQQ17074.1 hypothetical protein B0675_07975 [Streptomyces sp. M41(2017)]WSK62494.1 hypothetical protein OG458_22885 [Streptomyces sp. NBC_01281]
MKIQHVAHTVTGDDPSGLGLALTVARALHAPVRRAPELAPAASRPAARRAPARRRTVRS